MVGEVPGLVEKGNGKGEGEERIRCFSVKKVDWHRKTGKQGPARYF